MLKKLLPLLIVLVGIALFYGLKATAPEQTPIQTKNKLWQVETIPVLLGRQAPSITLNGQVETLELIRATAPIKSKVASIKIKEGDSFSKDQLLISLNERDFEPQVLSAQALVAELTAKISSEKIKHAANKQGYQHELALMNLAEKAVTRAKSLTNKKLGSMAALDKAHILHEQQALLVNNRKLLLDDHPTQIQQLNAQLSQANATLDKAVLNWERSQIRAPFDGFVGHIDVAQGEQVSENQQLIALYPSGNLEVRASIPVTYHSEIQQALEQQIDLNAKTENSGKPIVLKLNRLSGEADQRGIDALFKIIYGKDYVKPGNTLTLKLERPAYQNSVAVPYSAVYDNNKIYILHNDRLKAVAVNKLGDYEDEQGEEKLLVSGNELKNGERIIITHLPNAIAGMRVTTHP